MLALFVSTIQSGTSVVQSLRLLKDIIGTLFSRAYVEFGCVSGVHETC